MPIGRAGSTPVPGIFFTAKFPEGNRQCVYYKSTNSLLMSLEQTCLCDVN